MVYVYSLYRLYYSGFPTAMSLSLAVSATAPFFWRGLTRAELTPAGKLPCMKQALRRAARMGANMPDLTLELSSSWN